MRRNCYLMSVAFVRTFLSQNQIPVQATHHEYLITKRWAGHSKWANIKHTKMANDMMRSSAFQKIGKKIMMAVKEGGDNPASNLKLKSAIDEGHKINMPNTTIQNAIKRAKSEVKPYWVFYSSPGGVVLAFEVTSRSTATATSKLSQHVKKLNMKPESIHNNLGAVKGFIVAEPLKVENPLDKAVEDALDAGIEEVTEDENKNLIFECLPNVLDVAQKKLEAKGYKIESGTTEMLFEEYVKVSKTQMEIINAVLKKIESSYEDLVRITNNIEDVVND